MRYHLAVALFSFTLPGGLLAGSGSVSHFLLTDNEEFSAAFSEAQGIVSQSEVVESRLADPSDSTVKTPGRLMLTSITLKRLLSSDQALARWRQEMESGPGGATLARDVVLIAFDAESEEITRWNFHTAWPSRLSVVSREGKLWEELTIVFDELPFDEAEPSLPVIFIRLPTEAQTIDEPPVRVVAKVSSPDSEVEILHIYGEGELLREISGPGVRSEVEWNPSGDGTKTISVTVVDEHDRIVTVQRKFFYSPSPSIEYASWRQAWFLPDEDGSPEGDANLDGSANLIEFAFRGNPHRGGTSDRPSLNSEETRGAWAEFRYIRRTEGTGSAVDFSRADIRYLVEETTDLNTGWKPSPVPDGISRSATIVANAGGFTETVTIALHDDPPEGTLFMRLRISLR